MEEIIETEEEKKERIRSAERTHDYWVKAEEVHAEQIKVFSIAALRAPALTAAGGVAATLGFISANYSRLQTVSNFTESVGYALFFLLLGAIFAMLSPGAAYFSQLAYQHSIHAMHKSYFPPFSESTKASARAKKIGDIFRWATVIINILSIFCVIIGGFIFLRFVLVALN